ncbi:hypothetical protein VE02_02607 [Pseudogymnoascus sp. 03VT05]|nr:hypothetical protein VE02_02607 [Pseudogymnoascus sp. 03VT05]
MVSSRPLTWRIQNIPADFTEARLKSCFHSDDKKCIEIKSLVPDVSNYDGDGTLTATILFSPQEPREPRAEDYDDFDIDKDFIGFTPPNNPGGDVCADIISDYGSSFTQTLIGLRDHPSCRDRPLILIGHSLGALIIKQAITNLEPIIRSHLPVRTLIFFGAPHNGLEVTALETLVKGRPTQTLISELKRESPTLTGLSERFRHVAKDMTIHTYYESRPASTVAEGPDGQWERRGEARVTVERSSALLNVEPEKTRMKVDGDHKEIVRLRRGQGGVYPNILRIIKEALVGASEQFAVATGAALAAEIEEQEAEIEAREAEMHTRAIELEELAAEIVAEAFDVKLDPGFDQNTTGDIRNCNEYDDYNLICDICYDEFPKTLVHRHYYICTDGNYNICPACSANGRTCTRGHEMVSRELEYDEEDCQREYDRGLEEDGPKYIVQCNICDAKSFEDRPFFRCGICSDGNFFICISCRKAGQVCVRGHRLVKPQISLDLSNTSSAITKAAAEKTTKEIEVCDVSGYGLPKRPKRQKRPRRALFLGGGFD